MKTHPAFEHQDFKPCAVSVKTAAAMLQISTKSVRRLIERGLLKPSRALRVLRIPFAQIEKMLQETI